MSERHGRPSHCIQVANYLKPLIVACRRIYGGSFYAHQLTYQRTILIIIHERDNYTSYGTRAKITKRNVHKTSATLIQQHRLRWTEPASLCQWSAYAISFQGFIRCWIDDAVERRKAGERRGVQHNFELPDHFASGESQRRS